MALETGTFISDLVVTNPVASDPLAAADDHLRLIKTTVKNTFPNVTGAVTKTHTQLNNAVDKTGDTMTGALTLSGNASSNLHAVPLQQLTSAVQALYPVGSVYINATNATNPGTLLGFGTWVAFGAGRVPVGFNSGDTSFNAAEKTGGSKDAVVVSHTHTATVTDPGHTHTVNSVLGNESGPNADGTVHGFVNRVTTSSTTGITVTNSTTGVSGTNANLQPYITVYMWKRTA
jgi:hypothetical protein